MRILLVAMAVGIGLALSVGVGVGVPVAGCGGSTPPGGGGDLLGSLDMALHGDLAIANCGDAGTKLFGDACTTDCECQSSMCRQFHMGTVHYCTQPCTPTTATSDCPNPPSTGLCTNNGYCKF